jgi:hypothetical protein
MGLHIYIRHLETEKFATLHQPVYIKIQALALVNNRSNLQIQDIVTFRNPCLVMVIKSHY